MIDIYHTMYPLEFLKFVAAFGIATNGLYGPILSDYLRSIYTAMADYLDVIDTLCQEDHNYEWSQDTDGDWDSDSDIPKDLRSLFFSKTIDEYLVDGLMCAVINDDMQMVQWLIALGADGSPFDDDDDMLLL